MLDLTIDITLSGGYLEFFKILNASLESTEIFVDCDHESPTRFGQIMRDLAGDGYQQDAIHHVKGIYFLYCGDGRFIVYRPPSTIGSNYGISNREWASLKKYQG